MERLLITGCTGLLGSKLVEKAPEGAKVYGVALENPRGKTRYEFNKLDISDRDETTKLIAKLGPDTVIHTAALTGVDYCEEHPEEARSVNALGTENVALGCKKTGARLVYVSTDYVFDGKKGMYAETDTPNPINVYGKTKLEGEALLKEAGIDWCIARTSVLYGWHENYNFAKWVVGELREGKSINVVNGQYCSPTFADNLAEALLLLSEKGATGIFHTAGSKRVSRYEFAVKTAEIFGLDSNLINPVTSDKLRQKAKRPKDSSLDINKAKKSGLYMMDIYEGLNEMKGSE